MRDIVAEMIREQVLLRVRDEIPHGVAVLIEEYKERENGTVYIAATIFVERDTHKRIVIGKKGSLLRVIGKEARKEIEKMLEEQTYIELWVKVAPKWRHNDRDLKRFGYAS
jgi:GTP-binding protein Era